MADETTRVDAWLFDLLTNDAPLTALVGDAEPRIFADSVPQGEAFPAVVYQLQGGTDVRTATRDSRVMINGLWVVKAIGQTDTFADLAPIADRIDDLLEQSTGGPAGSDGAVFTATRESPFRLPEPDEGVGFKHLGGMYRIYAQVP